jgi:hypothetical protein
MAFQNLRVRARNFFIAKYNDWQENRKRKWTALSTYGGKTPLGKCNQQEAIDRAAKFGPVIYVDIEVATVFVSGSPPQSGS